MHSVVSVDPSVGVQVRIKGQGQNEMQRAGRPFSPDVSRGLTTLVGRVQSIRNPDRPGSRGVFFGPLVFVISA
jgi:hypothetical protein